jgi:hypothetical protein
MSKKNLLNANPYLSDPKLMAKMIHASVVTSTAIEGIHIRTPSGLKRASSRKKK